MDSCDGFIRGFKPRRSFRSRKVASIFIRWRSIRFLGVRRDPAPKDRPLLVPHIPIDRFLALPMPGLPSPETSGESPDSGEGRRRPGPPPGPARIPGSSPRAGRPQAKASRWPACHPGRLSSSDPQGMARPRWGSPKARAKSPASWSPAERPHIRSFGPGGVPPRWGLSLLKTGRGSTGFACTPPRPSPSSVRQKARADRDTLGHRGPPWNRIFSLPPFTSDEVPCHLLVPTHVRT